MRRTVEGDQARRAGLPVSHDAREGGVGDAGDDDVVHLPAFGGEARIGVDHPGQAHDLPRIGRAQVDGGGGHGRPGEALSHVGGLALGRVAAGAIDGAVVAGGRTIHVGPGGAVVRREPQLAAVVVEGAVLLKAVAVLERHSEVACAHLQLRRAHPVRSDGSGRAAGIEAAIGRRCAGTYTPGGVGRERAAERHGAGLGIGVVGCGPLGDVVAVQGQI